MVNLPSRTCLSAVLYAGILAVLTVLVFTTPLARFLSSPEELRTTVSQFGGLAPTIIIFYHALQVVVAPIPGVAIELANGYLFGWWGIAVSMAGLAIGSTIAIVLARQYGRPLVEVLITPRGMKQIKPYTRTRSYWLFFFLFLLPGTPDDLLCFAIGLTAIPLTHAVAIAILGRLPGVAASVLVGVTGSGLNTWEFTLLALAVSLALGLIVWKTPLGKKLTAKHHQRSTHHPVVH